MLTITLTPFLFTFFFTLLFAVPPISIWRYVENYYKRQESEKRISKSISAKPQTFAVTALFFPLALILPLALCQFH